MMSRIVAHNRLRDDSLEISSRKRDLDPPSKTQRVEGEISIV